MSLDMFLVFSSSFSVKYLIDTNYNQLTVLDILYVHFIFILKLIIFKNLVTDVIVQ